MKWNDGRTYKGQWINGIEKNVTILLDKPIEKSVRKLNNQSNTLVAPSQRKTS